MSDCLLKGNRPIIIIIKRDTLHWLFTQQSICYRAAAWVWHCLLGIAPDYFQELFPYFDNGRLTSTIFLLCDELSVTHPPWSCKLSCCSFYMKFTLLSDSIATKELRASVLQTVQHFIAVVGLRVHPRFLRDPIQ